jgi:dolichyl-phosphate-mannose-protein mannosyltransferase
MSTTAPAVKQRSAKKKASSAPVSDLVNGNADILESIQTQTKQAVKSEWDYKLALGVITVVALITRFWHITHPDEVVFDEVHFGKVGSHPK